MRTGPRGEREAHVDSIKASIGKSRYDAVIFDLDGVVTQTAAVHAAAWKRLFDAYLEERAARTGTSPGGAPDSALRPFDPAADYRLYVDGKPRYDGVRDFLASRGIELPRATRPTRRSARRSAGSATARTTTSTPRCASTACRPSPPRSRSSTSCATPAIRVGLMSSSKNTAMVLDVTGTTDLFEVRVDGVVAAEVGLPGKPDPAMYLETARRLGVEAARSVVVEDALSGVEAGRRGGFGLVIGVDRLGQAAELAQAGADVVVDDLAEVSVTA